MEPEPVLEITVVHVEPPSVDLSIWYPVIAEPPLLLGVLQDKLIAEVDTARAERFVGGCDTVIWTLVVADAVFDGELVPIALIAETR